MKANTRRALHDEGVAGVKACDICEKRIPHQTLFLEVYGDQGGDPPARLEWVICGFHERVLEGLRDDELVAAIRARILVRTSR